MDTTPDILVGIAGWSYPDWRGVVYPARPDRTPALKTIARLFDCVEINVSFYRPPDPGMAESWRKAVEDRPGFLFTSKVPKELTHQKDLEPAALKEGADRLLEGLEPLIGSGRLAALLLQFPFYFRDSPQSRERIERLAEAFRPVPTVVEVRHPGFLFGPLPPRPRPGPGAVAAGLEAAAAGPERRPPPPRELVTGPGSAIELFTRLGLGLANIDLPPGRGTFPPTCINTSPLGYVRLHGRNSRTWFDPKAGRDDKYNYLYSPKELAEWSERILRLGQRTQRTVVIFNNHFRGKAPANALQLLGLLGRPVPPPPPELAAAYPELVAGAGGAARRHAGGEAGGPR